MHQHFIVQSRQLLVYSQQGHGAPYKLVTPPTVTITCGGTWNWLAFVIPQNHQNMILVCCLSSFSSCTAVPQVKGYSTHGLEASKLTFDWR